MNVLDIIIIAILAFAVYGGLKDGAILQVCSLVGVVVGFYLATNYCDAVASALSITGEYSSLWGFIIAMIATLIVVALIARILRKIFSFIGFGILDHLLGVALSLCKYLLILSLAFSAFDSVNSQFKIIDSADLNKSKFYRPIANLSRFIAPAWEWTGREIKKV